MGRSQEKTLGEDNPEIAESLSQLAHLNYVCGRYSESERLLWRAVTICSKWFGQEHISVAAPLIDLGYLMESQERWPDAEHVYRLAYAVRIVNLGGAHRDTLQVARYIVRVMCAQGKPIV